MVLITVVHSWDSSCFGILKDARIFKRSQCKDNASSFLRRVFLSEEPGHCIYILYQCIHGFLLEPFAVALQVDVTRYNLASTGNFNYIRLTHLLKLDQLPQTYCAENYCAGCN